MALDEVIEDLRDFLYDNGNTDFQIEAEEEGFSIFLDLPNVTNFIYHMNELERFFITNGNYDVEDFIIDGDDEGIITAVCEA